jgi:hypothetical protein
LHGEIIFEFPSFFFFFFCLKILSKCIWQGHSVTYPLARILVRIPPTRHFIAIVPKRFHRVFSPLALHSLEASGSDCGIMQSARGASAIRLWHIAICKKVVAGALEEPAID